MKKSIYHFQKKIIVDNKPRKTSPSKSQQWHIENETELGKKPDKPVEMEIRFLEGKINKPFIWYCWNGTKYPCDFNRLPVTGTNIKNTGLVFQNSNFISSIVSSDKYVCQ